MNGWVGVDLFFVLSGFLIGFHLLRRWPDKTNFYFYSHYWLKRILRTFPLYYAALIIVLLGFMPFYRPAVTEPLEHLHYHIIFMQDYLGSPLLTPLWSLATEEKFYLLCPFLILLIRLEFINIRWSVGLLIAFSFLPLFFRFQLYETCQPDSYATFFWNFRAPFHMALDGLLLGLAVALIHYYQLGRGLFERHWKYLFYVPLTILLILLASIEWMNAITWKNTLWVLYIFPLLFSLLLIASIHCKGRINSFLSSRKLRFISRLSYCLYVCHMLVMPLTEHLFNSWTDKTGGLFIVVFFTCFIILSLILSIILHLLIEEPFLRLKDRVSLTPHSTQQITQLPPVSG